MDAIAGILLIALAVGTAVLCIALARQALDAARRNAIANPERLADPLAAGGLHEWRPERARAPLADGHDSARGAE